MIFSSGDRIVFAGDSVTDMGRARPFGEGLFDNVGHSYVRVVESMLKAFYPEALVRVTNVGSSGNTSEMLLDRYQTDVVDLKPDWVSICIGVNDVWRQFDSPTIPDEHVSPEKYEENVEKMIVSVKDNVKGIFILSPYIMEPNREDAMRKRMDEYVEASRRLAQKYNCIYVDFQELYEDYCKVQYSATVAWDRIHPNQVGATLMARAFLEKCDFDFNHKAF